MKINYQYNRTWKAMLTFIMGVLLSGCAGEDAFNDTIGMEESLSIYPQVTDAKTRVASDMSLNEAKLDKLDVKIFSKADATLKLGKTLPSMTQGTTATLDQGNWKDKNQLVENETYQVVTIANAKESLQGINVLSELAGKTQTDADIWKPYQTNTNPGKNFLMSSTTDYLVTTAARQTIQTSLCRAAAKILVKLNINVPGYTVGNPSWNFQNYNTATTFFGENSAKTLGNMSGAYESAMGENGNFTITTYSYATQWDNTEQMPKLIVKVPLTKISEDAEGEGAIGETTDNFYSIPVRDINETELKRNHIYTVNANITNRGSSTEIVYGTQADIQYDVMKWTEGEETVINADKHSYLLVTPTFHIMRNEKVDNKTIQFYASDACTVQIDEVYYYDKNGTKKTIKSGSTYPQISLNFANGHTEKKDQGIVNIQAKEFVPLTVKYIKFTISCGEGENKKTEQVTIKQYPLEYIQAIAGWYSTKSLDGWIDWQEHQRAHDIKKKSSDNNFKAKVYTYGEVREGWGWWSDIIEGTYIWEYQDEYKENAYQATLNKARKDQSNNNMYVVQITHTNGNYTIGHVNNINPTTKLSSEDVVSPAFALASQLGTVTVFSKGVNASKHCDDYVEVGIDGTRYDNWRLPTESEIKVIVNYQYKSGQDVVTEVLRGYSYWSLSGNLVTANPNGSDEGFVRCVRDLTPEEVTALENKKE